MKKFFLTLTCLFALTVGADGIHLSVTWDDPTNLGNPSTKAPVQVPELSIDDHTLYFFTPCDGCTLRLVDEDGVVAYSLVIPEGTVSLELPSTLSGNYELQILRGNYCFWGMLNL